MDGIEIRIEVKKSDMESRLLHPILAALFDIRAAFP
jgi:hypothetical protein